MWHKVIVVLHVAAFLHAHKVLHRVKVLPGARARQELLDGHGVAQEDRDQLKRQTGNTGSRSPYSHLVKSDLVNRAIEYRSTHPVS